MTSVGRFLVEDALPHAGPVRGALSNKDIHNLVVDMAKADPARYVETITRMKQRGDEISSLEGVSVGLDDIAPMRQARDEIIAPLVAAVQRESDQARRTKLIVDAQEKLLALTRGHPGSMVAMAASGARGNFAQLMKTVVTPLAANDEKKGVTNWVIQHSYAEGLTPAEYWTTMPEARANNVATVVSVSKPGEMTKTLVANMVNQVVGASDCGTTNGLRMHPSDPQVLDRYTAREEHGLPRNTLVTPQVVQSFARRGIDSFLLRSPMTCVAKQGVCQHCWGHDEKGKLPVIGTAAGVRSAQAMTEPLTQMALSSKHAVLTIRERSLEPRGFKGVRQLLEIPKLFLHEAALAPIAGRVEKIEKAPQGGHTIHVGGDSVYAAPELSPRVRPGDVVELGDALTDGVPHPAKLVAAKGIGAGRRYFVDALHRVYSGEGVSLDRRHLELLARSELNHVRLLDHDPQHPHLLKGDVIDYNAFKQSYERDAEHMPLADASGLHLGQEVLHHTVGTPITPSLVKSLAAAGVREASVLRRMPHVEFIMRPIAMNPMNDPDWIGRLAHRYLKGSLQQAAQTGEASELHGTHPVPGYAYGAEFGRGAAGRY
jgi:DNA-directed RNA polymerase subunit beta'